MVYFSQKSIFSFITIIFHQGEVKVNSNKTKVLQLLKICAAHFHYKQANLALGLWSSPWRTLTRILTRNLRCMDKQMERSEIIGPFRVNQRANNIWMVCLLSYNINRNLMLTLRLTLSVSLTVIPMGQLLKAHQEPKT